MRATRGSRLRRAALLCTVAATLTPLLSVPADAAGGAAWSRPRTLRGASAVTDGSATASTPFTSCWSRGSCALAGSYYDNHYNTRAFLDTESGGTWGAAQNVAGVANGAVDVQVNGLSCGGAGSCLAIGAYTTTAEENALFGFSTPFLEEEVAGTWQPAIDVPGLSALDPAGADGIDAVSCSSAGDCAVAGTFYTNETFATYVANEVHGRWGSATELPGLAAAGLSATGLFEAPVLALSCESSGNCILGGELFNGGTQSAGFVAEERGGVWRSAKPVPGLATLDVGMGGITSAASCSSPGNCTVGGTYLDGNQAPQAFLATEAKGTWSHAVEVPGTAALNAGGGMTDGFGDVFGAQVQTASCRGNGSCTIVGWYETRKGASDLFVDSEHKGAWAKAIAMPRLATLNAGASIDNDGAAAAGLDCLSVGNCVIAGNYVDGGGQAQIFTEREVSGVFGAAKELPGSASLAYPGFVDPFADTVDSLTCLDLRDCSVAGTGGVGGFLDDEAGGTWSSAQPFVTSPTVYVGTNAAVTKVSCPSAGDCAAVGTYRTADGAFDDFFAQESGGVWGPDQDLSTLSGSAPTGMYVDSFTCSSVGDCVLLGEYDGSDGLTHLVSETESQGTWQPPQDVPGLPPATKGGTPLLEGPRLEQASCPSALDCVGVGWDVTDPTTAVPFVVTEDDGHWSTSLDTTGTSKLPGSATLTRVSCPTAGSCVATGDDVLSTGALRVYAVAEVHGVWGAAHVLTSPTALSPAKREFREAFVLSLACTAVTTCVAAGKVAISETNAEPFVMSEVGGRWEPAELLPGFTALSKLVPRGGWGNISIVDLRCPTSATCVLVGSYPVDYQQGFYSAQSGFVLSADHGVWSDVVLLKVPKPVKHGKSSSTFTFAPAGLACVSAARCSILGVTEKTTTTRIDPTTWVDTYTYRVAYAEGAGTTYGTPVSDSAPLSTYDLTPYQINDVSCGATGACGAGGSADDGIAIRPFVMTTS